MKKLFACVAALALLAGCAQSKTIDHTTYGPYGLLNEGEMRNPDIHYRTSWGNVVLGVIFCETIVVPIYTFGFALYEPSGPETGVKGQVD